MKRRLLAIGTSQYDDNEGYRPLDLVPQAIRAIVDTFTVLGFECTELPNATKADFERAVDDFLASAAWGPEDIAVVYVTGHGVSGATGYFIAARDSVCGRNNSAVDPLVFVTALGDNPTLLHLLLILDTCFAQGGADAMAALGPRLRTRLPRLPGREYWVVTSARFHEEATQLVFAQAFTDALNYVRDSFGAALETIDLGSVILHTNLLLGSKYPAAHRATPPIPLMSTTDGPRFIANPKYKIPQSIPVAGDLAAADEYTVHWLDRARGGAADGSASLFEGRDTIIADILDWHADSSRPNLLVVTATPGTGKSALLAQFVVDAGNPDSLGHRLGVIRAIHAHGEPAESISARIDDILESPPAGATVIIDSLDEATNSVQIEDLVLQPLLARGINVVAGMRHALAGTIVAPADTVDLDQNFNADEVHRYVRRLLLESKPSPYAGRPELAGSVAKAVVSLTGGNFLLAGKIANALTRDPRPLSAAEVLEARQSFDSVAAVFDRDLDRIDDGSGRVRELLAVLAWSRGPGFPWEGLWPALANALFDQADYTNDDVQQVLSSAGDYVVETPVGGHSYYRLYHELFAEHLRKGTDAPDAHRRITEALIAETPTTPDGKHDWFGAHPYVRDFFAEHAARGGVLNELLVDPGLVLAMEPVRLGIALSDIRNPTIGVNAAAVLGCLNHLRSDSTASKASQLELSAMQCGAVELARQTRGYDPTATWRPEWARWAHNPPQTMLTRLGAEVDAMCVLDGDEPVVVATAGDEVVCVDVVSARDIWRKAFPHRVTAIAATPGTVAVSCGSGPIYLLDARTGDETATLPGPDPIDNESMSARGNGEAAISALALTATGDGVLLAVGTRRETTAKRSPDDEEPKSGRLRLWTLGKSPQFSPQLKWNVEAFGVTVRTLSWRRTAGELQIVAAGDPFPEPPSSATVARVFDAETGTVVYEGPNDLGMFGDATVAADGAVLICPCTSRDGHVVRWIPESGEVLHRVITTDLVTSVGTLTPDGAAWLVGTRAGVIPISPTTLEPLGEGLAYAAPVRSLAVAGIGGSALVLTGLSQGEVTRWDLAASDSNHTAARLEIRCCSVPAAGVVACAVYDGSDALETISPADGAVLARTERIVPIALHVTAGRPHELLVAVPGSPIMRYSLNSHQTIAPPLELHDGSVRYITDTRGLLLTCGDDARVQFVEPESGTPVCPPVRHIDYKERPLNHCDVVDIAGTASLVALDYDGELVVWDWAEVMRGEVAWNKMDDVRNAAHRDYFAGYSSQPAFGVWQHNDSTAFLRSGQHGEIHLSWFPRPDNPDHPQEEQWSAHTQQVTVIERLGDNVVVTADNTGLLRVWWLPNRSLLTEASLGAAITVVRVIGSDQLLVGTASGLILIRLQLTLPR